MSREAALRRAFAGLPARLQAIIDKIREKAPGARIAFINYTTGSPDTGTCPQLHLTEDEAEAGCKTASQQGSSGAASARPDVGRERRGSCRALPG